MHILIIETDLVGHHGVYLEQIAIAHLSLNRKVTLIFSIRNADLIKFDKLKSCYGENLQIELIDNEEFSNTSNSILGQFAREIYYWRLFRKCFIHVKNRIPVDFVFLPYVDYCLNFIGLAGSPFDEVKWGGICMRQTFHFPEMMISTPISKLKFLKEFLFRRVLDLPSLATLFTIDETLPLFFEDNSSKSKGKLCYLPDPSFVEQIISREVARSFLKLPIDAKVILVYGALDARKGLKQLLEALIFDQRLNHFHLLIVGQQDMIVRELLSDSLALQLKKSERIHEVNHFVDSHQEQATFSASNVVWLGYDKHYTMSGVLVKAVQYGVPVLGTREGLIGWHIRKDNLGIDINAHDIREIADALVFMDHNVKVDGNTTAAWRNLYSWDHARKLLVNL